MSATELVPVRETTLELERQRFMPVMTTEIALQRRAMIAEAVKSILESTEKGGEDFGVIPGSKKPTLLQPGAQKLDNLFGLVPRYSIERTDEDWTGERHGGEPFFRYMVRCQCMRGDFVMGEGIGECNSWESKYRYRMADRKCPDCGAGAIIKTKKKSWWCAPFKGGCSAGFGELDKRITDQEIGRKPNPEIFDQVNTLLKMAEKRAHMLATINATSASEFFTQDLEDRAPEVETESVQQNTDTEQAALAERRIAEERAKARAARPIPEELKLAFERMEKDWGGKALGEAFKLVESVCGSNEAKALYSQRVLAYRGKYKPAQMTLDNAADCILDLWEALQKLATVPVEEQYAWENDFLDANVWLYKLGTKELGRVVHDVKNNIWSVELGSMDQREVLCSRTGLEKAQAELVKRYEAKQEKSTVPSAS